MNMAGEYRLTDLIHYNRRIEALAASAGLDFYLQEFELCSYEDMLSHEAYLGLPTRYPHWSFGKSYERKKTYYSYNLTGLPYEMVVNSNPCLAYLMKENSLLLQILTMAHVYGHNDFFKNNRLFRQGTRAQTAMEMFNAHARRVREYAADPSIGAARVERLLDGAHALRLQTCRIVGERILSREEVKKRFVDQFQPRSSLHPLLEEKPAARPRPDLEAKVLQPQEDILLFLVQNAHVNDWEKDVLEMVREESLYFLPQIETKIMNEGWASFWHHRLLQRLHLPQHLQLEFLKRHNQVVCAHEGSINPYHLGFKIFTKIAAEPGGEEKIFQVRAQDRDVSFLLRFLDKELCQDLNLFQYTRSGRDYVINEVADEEGWRKIRQTLAGLAGINGIPNIRVADVEGSAEILHLEHEGDGRELQVDYAVHTLKHIAQIWGRKVCLHTITGGKSQIIDSDAGSKAL